MVRIKLQRTESKVRQVKRPQLSTKNLDIVTLVSMEPALELRVCIVMYMTY